MSITILTTLPSLVTSVVSHKTGTSNTAEVRFNQKLMLLLIYLPDGLLNISTSQELLLPQMVMMSLERLPTTPPLKKLSTGMQLEIGLPDTKPLSQKKNTQLNIQEIFKLSEEENTCGLLSLTMVQESLLMVMLSLITGANTEAEEENIS
jgi:hypothetical protein